MEQNARIYQDLDRILVTKEEITRKVKELGEKITEDYAGKAPVMVCILKGAVMFFSDLIREIDLPVTCDFMAISSYGSATKTSGVVRVLKAPSRLKFPYKTACMCLGETRTLSLTLPKLEKIEPQPKRLMIE